MRDIVLCSQWVKDRRHSRNVFFDMLLNRRKVKAVVCHISYSGFFLGGVKDEYN